MIRTLNSLSQTPYHTFLTCFIMAVLLSLPLICYVSIKNLLLLEQHAQNTAHFLVYLKPNVTETEVNEFTRQLTSYPPVKHIQLISPTEALKELQTQTGLHGINDALPTNPLPWSLLINLNPTPTNLLTSFIQTVKELPLVEDIQFNMAGLIELNTLLKVSYIVTLLIAVLLGFSVMLISYQATLLNQAASNYTGLLYGLISSLLAWLAVDFLLFWLKKPVADLTDSYQIPFQLTGVNVSNTLIFIVISACLTWAGAGIAQKRRLN